MTKEEWIAKAQARYMERAALDNVTAEVCANAIYDDYQDDEPEDAVDEDLTYWTD